MRIDYDVADPDVRPYPLLTATVVPRPIAWVSSLSSSGVGNLAPHSFFNVACANPPILMFTSVGGKDTLRNVRETGEFVVNLASLPQLEAVNESSAPFEEGDDESGLLGITMEPSATVAPERVADSPVAFECSLHSTNELGDSTLVLGSVRLISVAEEVLVDGHPEVSRLQPLSRLGRNEWGRPPEAFALDRPRRPRPRT